MATTFILPSRQAHKGKNVSHAKPPSSQSKAIGFESSVIDRCKLFEFLDSYELEIQTILSLAVLGVFASPRESRLLVVKHFLAASQCNRFHFWNQAIQKRKQSFLPVNA